ncbi:cytochrome c [Candidatus Binatia bacterium]|nr:cytochrome c [Candidatus Binatia bacterium]
MRTQRERGARARAWTAALAATAVLASAGGAIADEPKHELPPGPIHDRHELMEEVGANAKKIGAAAKAGKPGDAQAPAEAIAQALSKFVGMFPAGSESPLSRAKPNVWTDKAKFDELAKKNEQAAMALAAVAKAGGDLKAPSGAMFQTCKACHDEFRVPKEGE